MNKTTSISLGNHFEGFIAEQIHSGRFTTKSEVVRAALRLLEQEEEKVRLLRQALIEGEQSGFIDDFDPVQFKKHLQDQYSDKARS